MILSNPHTHTTFCDGASSAEEMVQAALSLGFTSLGFSGHSYYPDCLDYCMTPEGTLSYQAEIHRLQAAYDGRLRIRLGLELDYYSQVDLTPYEYYIGSVHHYRDPTTGEFYAFDGSTESFLHMLRAGFHDDVLAMARVYYDLVVQTVTQPRQGRRPDIIGHFNLITKRNLDHHRIDEDDPAYKAIAYEALRACAETDAIFEINTGAIARGYARMPYPNLDMLRYLREHGSRIIISSDCHRASGLDCGFELAASLAREAGFRSVMVLGTDQLFEEISL